MKLLFSICLLFVLPASSFAQDCTREIAKTTTTVLEKGWEGKPFAVKDAVGKKLGDNLYPLFASAIQQSKGLHGYFNISEANEHVWSLTGYHAYSGMFYVYCRKDGKLDWKGLYNLKFDCISNYIPAEIGEELNNQQVGSGPNYFVYQDNNIIYLLKPRKATRELNGYPFIEALSSSSSAKNAVLITKKGVPFFLPVNRRQYLLLMKKSTEVALAIQKKMLAESIKEKLGIENSINISINYSLNDTKEIDAFLASHDADYLNKPCITNHELESLFGKKFPDDKDYFLSDAADGKAWVIINPGYINKKLPANIPQLFSFTWSQGEKEVEKNAAFLFKQTFDFKKLETLLQ
ncbi:MAG: hypothetical protein ABI685_02485 [Ferruginibacter sp.]